MSVNPFKLALIFGLFLALWHTCWVILVYFGLAQPLLNFVFWAHFITPPYHIEAFEPARAGILIGLTFAVGYVVGGIGALLWNLFHRETEAG